MRTELSNKCELFAENRELVEKRFSWENRYMTAAAATFYTNKNQELSVEALKSCKKVLKKHTGAFSDFRHNMTMPLAAKMALSGDPEGYLLGVKDIYEQLKSGNWAAGEYRVVAAMMIYENRDRMPIGKAIERTRALKKIVKNNHPWITSSEDLSMIALLATLDKDLDAIVEDMEACHTYLQTGFKGHQNAVQSLAMTLATNGMDAKEKCDKVIAIYDALKMEGKHYGKGMELAVLGTLACIEVDAKTLAEELDQVDDYLKTRKGFGAFGLGKQNRMMYASMLVADSYVAEECSQAAVINTALASAIAAQASIMISIAAISASSTYSS